MVAAMPADLLRRDDLARHCVYERGVARTAYAPLQGDARCDVAVVGGGLAGLSAAIELAERGFAVTLLEARRVGSGASGRNGGQVLPGLACEPAWLEARLGRDGAQRIWDATLEGMALIRRRCLRFAIDAEWRDGHLLAAVGPRQAKRLRAMADDLARRHGHALRYLDAREVRDWIASPRYVAALHDPRAGHLQPLKYALGLARAAAALGVTLHERTPALRLLGGARPRLEAPQGTLTAGRVLLAGNAYLEGLAPQVESHIVRAATYLAATEPLPPATASALVPSGAAVSDASFVLDYFRVAADGRLLFGGGEGTGRALPRGLEAMLLRRLLRVFPQLEGTRLEAAWGGWLDLTANRAPDFGRIAAAGEAARVYYVQGFCGHGLALAGLAGRVVAEAMAGDATRFDTFARIGHRPFPGGARGAGAALRLALAWYRLRDALAP